MKKLVLIIILSLIFSFNCFAGVSKLAWDSASGTVDGYHLYVQQGNDVRTIVIDIDVRTYLLSDLNLKLDTHYKFWIKAFNNNGEGPSSNILDYYSSVPGAPALRFVFEVSGAVSITE